MLHGMAVSNMRPPRTLVTRECHTKLTDRCLAVLVAMDVVRPLQAVGGPKLSLLQSTAMVTRAIKLNHSTSRDIRQPLGGEEAGL